MPTLLHKEFGLVKGERFHSWRRTGSAMQQIKVYNLREVDELVFFDIAASINGRAPDYDLVDDLADDCFMPMTVGGGITTLEQAGRMLRVGADKVSINSGAVSDPPLISRIADRFGSQCVVVSIDFTRHPDGRCEVFTHSGSRPTGLDPVDFAVQAERLGAGEVLLTSIDRDGTFLGYDIECTRQVSKAVSLPVIASGGAGNYQHMVEVVKQGGASAVAASAMFHFTEQTPAGAKAALHEAGIPVRSIVGDSF
ncbi:MAG TPA: imidazole glycerol phosphate synthase cyclase subunit [Candidatus Acidoferrum sp.]|nr:imidazole glycerol phosphate synthase cyclase subunit [Candidatus Acidoferrum sp.]